MGRHLSFRNKESLFINRVNLKWRIGDLVNLAMVDPSWEFFDRHPQDRKDGKRFPSHQPTGAVRPGTFASRPPCCRSIRKLSLLRSP